MKVRKNCQNILNVNNGSVKRGLSPSFKFPPPSHRGRQGNRVHWKKLENGVKIVPANKDKLMKVAIIGGSGKMGRWFANFLLKDGMQVIITGRSEKKLLEAKQQLGVETATSIEAVKSADVVLISVPIDNFEEVVKQLQPYLHSKQVIIDITSIKVFPVETMHKHKNRLGAGYAPGVWPRRQRYQKSKLCAYPY